MIGLGVLFPLVFVMLVVVLVAAIRQSRNRAVAIGTHSVRRFFQYAVLYVLVVLASTGLSGLLGRLFGAAPEPGPGPDYLLARALGYTAIALPVALGLGWWIWREHRRDKHEQSSALYATYLTAVCLTAAVMIGTAVPSLFYEASEGRLDVDALGALIIWSAIWWVHWTAARATLSEQQQTPHLLLGSALGLVMMLDGLVGTIGSAVKLLTVHPFIGPVAGLADSLGVLIVGALIWVRYWATTAIYLKQGLLWQIYVIPIGIGTGLTMALVASSELIWSLLVWFVGDPGPKEAIDYFADAGYWGATVGAGLLTWWYYRRVLGTVAIERTEARRIYEYLIAGISLVASVTGIGAVLDAFLESVTPGIDIAMSSLNTLLLGLTLLVVGGTVWGIFWAKAQRSFAVQPAVEAGSPTRRIYLAVFLGAASSAAVISLVAIAVIFFQDLILGDLGLVTVRSMRYAFGVLLAASALTIYHAMIYVSDKKIRLKAHLDWPKSVLLVGVSDPQIVRAVESSTGAQVELWTRLDGRVVPWDQQTLLAQLHGRAGQRLLAISQPDGIHVIAVDIHGRLAQEGWGGHSETGPESARVSNE